MYRDLLLHPNQTDTGKLLGMCPLCVGMPVRLTTKISMKHGLVQETVGTIVDFEFHANESASVRGDGWIRLDYVPTVFVHFPDCKEIFADNGGAGVVAITPAKNGFDIKIKEPIANAPRDCPQTRRIEISVTRTQCPLAPGNAAQTLERGGCGGAPPT